MHPLRSPTEKSETVPGNSLSLAKGSFEIVGAAAEAALADPSCSKEKRFALEDNPFC